MEYSSPEHNPLYQRLLRAFFISICGFTEQFIIDEIHNHHVQTLLEFYKCENEDFKPEHEALFCCLFCSEILAHCFETKNLEIKNKREFGKIVTSKDYRITSIKNSGITVELDAYSILPGIMRTILITYSHEFAIIFRSSDFLFTEEHILLLAKKVEEIENIQKDIQNKNLQLEDEETSARVFKKYDNSLFFCSSISVFLISSTAITSVFFNWYGFIPGAITIIFILCSVIIQKQKHKRIKRTIQFSDQSPDQMPRFYDSIWH
ncbi:MAG: hypothetical protein LBJ93_01385 [Clostridiales bacterium]|jgi:hypothetical protein|nr:hypothetical protein [Clostridiales bacterium]